MLRSTLMFSALAILLLAQPALAQRPNAPQSSELRPLFSVDSMEFNHVVTSPDGRWAVFPSERKGSSSLYLARVGSKQVLRLTDTGYQDAKPIWFESGDRIAFVSTRANRNGAGVTYAMLLDIDRTTGQARGAPRQVTLEATSLAVPSPDGQWIAYATPRPFSVKLVPVNGGTARQLMELPNGPAARGAEALTFSRDGRELYYVISAKATFSLNRVSLSGGAFQNLVNADHPIAPLPADPRYIAHFLRSFGYGPAPSYVELRTQDDRRVARVEIPGHTRPVGRTGGGRGFVFARVDDDYSVRVVPVSGGPIRVVTPRSDNWMEGWLPDGSGVVTDKYLDGKTVVEVVPLNGGQRKLLQYPAGASNSGGSGIAGYEISYYAGVKNRDGVVRSLSQLHAMDLRTGRTRLVTDRMELFSFWGRGGYEQDGDRFIWAEITGTADATVYVAARGQTAQPIRVLPRSLASSVGAIHVNGARVAYLQTTPDSVRLMLTVDLRSPVRRLVAWPKGSDSNFESIAWSYDGKRIAVSHQLSTSDRPAITIVDVPTNDQPARTRVYTIGRQAVWSMRWLPDDSGLIVHDGLPSGGQRAILHLPLATGEPVVLTAAETYSPIDLFEISPDGRYVAYNVRMGGGTSAFAIDFGRYIR